MTDIGNLLMDGIWLWTSLAGLSVGVLTFVAAVSGSSMAPILVMLTVPLQRTVLVGDGGTYLTWTQVALAAFFAGALLLQLRGNLRIPVDVVTIASFALVSAYGLSIVAADQPPVWAGETYRWTAALVFLTLARPYALKANAGRNLAFGLAAMALVMLATGGAQAIAGAGPSSFARSGLTRAYGAFGEPNPFGAFAVMVTLPCLGLAIRGSRRRPWGIHGFAAFAGMAGIVAIASSQSRGAFLGLLAGLIALAVISWSDRGYPLRQVVIPAAAAGAAVLIIVATIATSGSGASEDVTSANWAERERQAHWGAATRMLLDHPVLGVGAGGFDDHFRGDTTEWRFRISQGHAHNAYLQVAAETGAIGSFAYFALLGVIGWRLLGRVGERSGSWRAWGAIAVTAAIAVHSVFDYLHVLSLGIVLSGIWANGLAGTPRGVAPGEHNPSL